MPSLPIITTAWIAFLLQGFENCEWQRWGKFCEVKCESYWTDYQPLPPVVMDGRYFLPPDLNVELDLESGEYDWTMNYSETTITARTPYERGWLRQVYVSLPVKDWR